MAPTRRLPLVPSPKLTLAKLMPLWRNSKQLLGRNLSYRFYVLALKTGFFWSKKDIKKVKISLSIIFEKNAKHEKIKTPSISVKKVFFWRQKKIKKIKIRITIIFWKNRKINKLFQCGFLFSIFFFVFQKIPFRRKLMLFLFFHVSHFFQKLY